MDQPVAFPLLIALTCVVASLAPAHAACPSHERINTILRYMEAREPVRGLRTDLSLADAECGQRRLVDKLGSSGNRVVGYKAGLTSRAAQERFGIASPVRGVLLERMLLADGAEVAADFGARPALEPDLLVVVRDSAIHRARTPLEALRSISMVVPFIELPDLVVAEGEKLSASLLVLLNVGARLGVVGRGIPVEATPEFARALAAMRVVVLDQKGKELASGTGAAILDHPLEAVLWLARDLERSRIRLRAGDLLSLGSFTAPLVPRSGLAVTVRYEGLPGNPEVSVRFK
ncbi:MAG TPA: fumarylacetoacetate hydrolase [Burkholderiales bacterium]|nr:fumarylacetoacetate hydrolase [Burkholderiales bacterium]